MRNFLRVTEHIHWPGIRAAILMKCGWGMLMVGWLCAAATLPLSAQTQPPAAHKETPPLSHLYWHFMMHQLHLDQVAAARTQQGKNGAWLRNYYQQQLGFNDAQFQPVRDTATQLQAELKAINDRVQTLVTADQASHVHHMSGPQDLPPPIAELAQLAQQHEAILQKEMGNLQAALGPDRAAKLDDFLQKNMAPKVTMKWLAPPQRHMPSSQAGPAFREVQP